MPAKLSKKIFDKDGKYGWLIQPTAFTFMRYDYSLMQQKIYATIIDILQSFFLEEKNNIIKNHYIENSLLRDNSWIDYEKDFQDDDMIWDKRNLAIPVKIKLKSFNVPHYQYPDLKEALIGFSQAPVSLKIVGKSGLEWEEYTSLCRIRIPKNIKKSTHVYAIFERRIALEMFNAMRSGYTKFLKEVIFYSKCKYTSRFYFFLSAFRPKSTCYIPYNDLRLYLCLGVKYKDFRFFKHSILDVVKTEMKALYDTGFSNLFFDYSVSSDNGKDLDYQDVEGISFNITSNSDSQDIIETPFCDDTRKKNIYTLLTLYCGCSYETAKAIVTNIDSPELYMKAVEKIMLLEEKFKKSFSSITNREAYTVQVFKNLFVDFKKSASCI